VASTDFAGLDIRAIHKVDILVGLPRIYA